jgi:hypothetical protein
MNELPLTLPSHVISCIIQDLAANLLSSTSCQEQKKNNTNSTQRRPYKKAIYQSHKKEMQHEE